MSTVIHIEQVDDIQKQRLCRTLNSQISRHLFHINKVELLTLSVAVTATITFQLHTS